ncbi:MAG: hypothetical protein M1819_006297 [Sarea resinae]|nr:MAG: hypothetical protein M1819_006297 [Sarea resinae]
MVINPSSASGGDAAPQQVASEEAKLVAASAKMNLGVLQAQLRFLNETGSLTAEMEDLVSSMTTTATATGIRSVDTVQKPGRDAPQSSSSSSSSSTRETLLTPVTYLVTSLFIGTSAKEIIAAPGHRIIAYAHDLKSKNSNSSSSCQGGDAIGYNPANNTTGRIPLRCLQRDEGSDSKSR